MQGRLAPKRLLQYLERRTGIGKHRDLLDSLSRGWGTYDARQVAVEEGIFVTIEGFVSSEKQGNGAHELVLTRRENAPLQIWCER
jgi:hypothetical protein